MEIGLGLIRNMVKCYETTISTHQNIILGLKSNKSKKLCDIQILSDFNVNILNFAQHELTNTYLESMFSTGHLPVITRPTRIHHVGNFIYFIYFVHRF